MNNENNVTFLQGRVVDDPILSHKVKDEEFYTFNLSVLRLSEQQDIIPMTISKEMLEKYKVKAGDKLSVTGQFRSFNKLVGDKSKLVLSVFVKEIVDWVDETNPNTIELNGYICKTPNYRVTPFNREICDVLLAVNRNFNRSDYIPCIAWGKNARIMQNMVISTAVKIKGRIQSREYTKHNEQNGENETKVAYEVSISTIEA